MRVYTGMISMEKDLPVEHQIRCSRYCFGMEMIVSWAFWKECIPTISLWCESV